MMKSEKIDNLLIKILTETADPAEREDFENWLSKAEENKVRFQKIRILWERLKVTYDTATFDEAAAKEKIRFAIQQISSKTRRLKNRFLIPAAASILLLMGLGLIAFYTLKSGHDDYKGYTSGNNIKEIVLPDNSHVLLNENSTLHAPEVFSGNNRKVMIQGEGYFEVTRDETRPFKVKAGKTIIKVLGTAFSVKTEKESQNVSVFVNSGKVSFSRSGSLKGSHILTPGTKGKYMASNREIKTAAVTDQNYLSWKTGILSFDAAPVDEVCSLLSRHYHKKITTTLSDTNLTLTGSFYQESLEEILETIRLTLDIKVKASEDEYVLYQ